MDEYASAEIELAREVAAAAMMALRESGMTLEEIDGRTRMPIGSFQRWLVKLAKGHGGSLSTAALYFAAMGFALRISLEKDAPEPEA